MKKNTIGSCIIISCIVFSSCVSVEGTSVMAIGDGASAFSGKNNGYNGADEDNYYSDNNNHSDDDINIAFNNSFKTTKVLLIQELLNLNNYNIKIDGDIGKETRKAIKKFQLSIEPTHKLLSSNATTIY